MIIKNKKGVNRGKLEKNSPMKWYMYTYNTKIMSK